MMVEIVYNTSHYDSVVYSVAYKTNNALWGVRHTGYATPLSKGQSGISQLSKNACDIIRLGILQKLLEGKPFRFQCPVLKSPHRGEEFWGCGRAPWQWPLAASPLHSAVPLSLQFWFHIPETSKIITVKWCEWDLIYQRQRDDFVVDVGVLSCFDDFLHGDFSAGVSICDVLADRAVKQDGFLRHYSHLSSQPP